jgi:hypothetical protein
MTITPRSTPRAEYGNGPPGGHPHNDRPNWQPGDDDTDELLTQKIRDAIRDGVSERKMAKLLGIPRSQLWKGKAMAAIPEDLFNRLMAARVGGRALVYIGRFFTDPDNPPNVETECCPNCGQLLRTRNKAILRAFDIVQQWHRDGRSGASRP